MSANVLPWVSSPPPEVPLADTPLIRVIAQVRFPLVASMDKQDFIAPFQEAIRDEYPILRAEQSRGVVLGPQGVMETRTNIWRFLEANGPWRVSVASEFLALETSRYTSRADFIGRLERVLRALGEHMDPKVTDRIGLRYIDRIVGENYLRELPRMVRAEVSGVVGTPLESHALHAVSENLFALPEPSSYLLARWGLLPANATVDPAAVEPIAERSWLLDTDAFIEETRTFDVGGISAQARDLAAHVYGFFRWVITDEFITRYGGKP